MKKITRTSAATAVAACLSIAAAAPAVANTVTLAATPAPVLAVESGGTGAEAETPDGGETTPPDPGPTPDPDPVPTPDPEPTPDPDPGPTPAPDPAPDPDPGPPPTPGPAPDPETTDPRHGGARSAAGDSSGAGSTSRSIRDAEGTAPAMLAQTGGSRGTLLGALGGGALVAGGIAGMLGARAFARRTKHGRG